ncbi:MAG: GDP-mannose 4,6-dehydratase, partial [Dysgonamonadaceae bacterium]|nr:GDP-mannose 4,6-dehydratase [Dysgonamonadaceae bacterium]
AFKEIGVIVEFKGEGAAEQGLLAAIDTEVFVQKIGENYLAALQNRLGEAVVKVDPQYFRPTEVELLIGDATKSRTKLGWKPDYDLDALIEDMMASDVKNMKKEAYLKDGGYRILNYFE